MNNLGIDEERAKERAEYWEQYIKKHPLEEEDEDWSIDAKHIPNVVRDVEEFL